MSEKGRGILTEHLVNELKLAQLGALLNNYSSCIAELNKVKNAARESEIAKLVARSIQKSVLVGNVNKRRFSDYNNRGRRACDKLNKQYGTQYSAHDDFKVRHSYNSNFKNRCPPRSGKINYRLNNKSSHSNSHVNHGGENSVNSGDKDAPGNNNNSQLFNSGQSNSNTSSKWPAQSQTSGNNKSHSQSNTSSNWPTQSQTSGNNKSHGNESRASELNLKRPSVRSEPSKGRKRPAPRASFSEVEGVTSALKPKTEDSSNMEHDHGKRSHSQTTGPGGTGGRRKISDLVINRIKSDKKFQSKVKTLIETSNPTVNKTLIDENAKSEPPVVENVHTGDEEMDWETSDQESMIEQIKAIRKSLQKSTNVSSKFALQSNNSFQILSDNLLLVLDTNVFISCLPFIKDIRDAFLPDLGLPSIFIPWAVLRELDHLKMTGAEQIAKSAMKAIRYINETFSSNHPRVSGQSFEDFCLMKNTACACTDDEILNVCLHLRMVDSRRKVVLITNDRNLESKAFVSGMEAYSKQRFVDEIINKTKDSENEASSYNMMVVKYTLYPKLKLVMKIALEMVVEAELKKAFGHNWACIVVRKPPWSLTQVFDCLLKHWRSVFTFTFKSELYSEIEDVKKTFMSEDLDLEKGQKFSNLIDISVDFLESVRHQISIKASSPQSSQHYMTLVEHLSKALHEIELLRGAESKIIEEQSSDVQMQNSAPAEVEDITIVEPPAIGTDLCKEEVKALLQIIWNQVQSFCFRVTELATNCGAAGPDVVEDVKDRFPGVMHKLEEFIQNIERIVSMEPKELARSGQSSIIDFTNLLVSLNILEAGTLKTEVLLKNVKYFCCDDDSRGVLQLLINDFKQFGNKIMDGMKCLGFI